MAIGDRIKRIRNMRGMTQKELGLAVGFDEKTADVRIAQYESNTRTPKEDMLWSISEALNVNYRAIYEPTLYAAEDVMYTLFELDEHYKIQLHDIMIENDPKRHHIAISFNYKLLNDLLKEWKLRKKELDEKEITKKEYTEWKINWPQTTDGCGKFKPSIKWKR